MCISDSGIGIPGIFRAYGIGIGIESKAKITWWNWNSRTELESELNQRALPGIGIELESTFAGIAHNWSRLIIHFVMTCLSVCLLSETLERRTDRTKSITSTADASHISKKSVYSFRQIKQLSAAKLLNETGNTGIQCVS